MPSGDFFNTITIFTVGTPVSRMLTELMTHVSQSLFMFGIAVERYILVCHPTRAKDILTPLKRLLVCLAMIFLVIILSVPACYDYYLVYERYIAGHVSVTLGFSIVCCLWVGSMHCYYFNSVPQFSFWCFIWWSGLKWNCFKWRKNWLEIW